MKLIGATDYFVRAPFVVEGIVIGLIGALIPLWILYMLYGKIILYIGEKFNFISSMLRCLTSWYRWRWFWASESDLSAVGLQSASI